MDGALAPEVGTKGGLMRPWAGPRRIQAEMELAVVPGAPVLDFDSAPLAEDAGPDDFRRQCWLGGERRVPPYEYWPLPQRDIPRFPPVEAGPRPGGRGEPPPAGGSAPPGEQEPQARIPYRGS